jgi:hypothetical protein
MPKKRFDERTLRGQNILKTLARMMKLMPEVEEQVVQTGRFKVIEVVIRCKFCRDTKIQYIKMAEYTDKSWRKVEVLSDTIYNVDETLEEHTSNCPLVERALIAKMQIDKYNKG